MVWAEDDDGVPRPGSGELVVAVGGDGSGIHVACMGYDQPDEFRVSLCRN